MPKQSPGLAEALPDRARQCSDSPDEQGRSAKAVDAVFDQPRESSLPRRSDPRGPVAQKAAGLAPDSAAGETAPRPSVGASLAPSRPTGLRRLVSKFLENPYPDIESLGEIAAARPSHIWIEPTSRCHMRCVHCAHHYSEFGQDMSEDLFRQIRDSVLDGVARVELIGHGEPFLAPRFGAMLDDCARRGIEVFTTTNGVFLQSGGLLSRIVRNNVTLCLSVDGATRETFEFVRPRIRWEGMIETLERIKQTADAAGPEKRFHLRFNFVAMKRTIGDLPGLVRLAAQYGAETIFVLPLGGEDVFEKVRGQSLADCPERISQPLLQAFRLAARAGVQLTLPSSYREAVLNGPQGGKGPRGKVMRLVRAVRFAPNYLRRRGWGQLARAALFGFGPKGKAATSYCTAPWNDAYFASDGSVYPCPIMGERLGDMTRQSWDEIWNGPRYRNLRRTIHSWNPTAPCRHCPFPLGANAGDERQYRKFFSRFRREKVPLDSWRLQFDGGFHDLEWDESGRPTQRAMGRQGSFSMPARRGAKFLQLEIVPAAPNAETFNAGCCAVDNGPREPFDTTCPEIHFPLPSARNGRLHVTIEMENAFPNPAAAGERALVIRGIHYLV